MADAPDLGSGVLDVGVQVPLSAPAKRERKLFPAFSFENLRSESGTVSDCVLACPNISPLYNQKAYMAIKYKYYTSAGKSGIMQTT